MTTDQQVSQNELWSRINSGATLVTVNRRLARKMAADHAAQMAAAGIYAWESPQILPYRAWLEKLYDSLVLNWDSATFEKWPGFLSESQELWLWEIIIRQTEYGGDLLQARAAAKTAQQARAICLQWHLDLEMLSDLPPADTEAFIHWSRQFEEGCRVKDWCEAARLPDLVAEAIRQECLTAPADIIFAGFDEFSPQLESLLLTIESTGTRVSMLKWPPPASEVACHALADMESEITQAALWARKMLETDPEQRIGVIVLDLEAARQKIIRIFDDILHPGLVCHTGEDLERLYNISLGSPLSDYPMIQTALGILENAGAPISAEDAAQLLRSPFLGGAQTELTRRSILDRDLRKRGETDIEMHPFLAAADAAGCRLLGKQLRAFIRVCEAMPQKQTPSGWAQSFAAILGSLEWPGERSLSSTAFQTLDAWQEGLARFAAMDRVMGRISREHAVQGLSRLLADTPFQPETGVLPIQVMGVLESAGEAFDAAWIMGLHSENWPPPPRPNPLIPIWLQRKANVVHASAERELAYARRVTERLLTCAPRVVISYPCRQGDTQLFSSPLIRQFSVKTQTLQTSPPPGFWEGMLESAVIEQRSDPNGPAIRDGEFIRGGTGLLKAQAACPFSAFARYRLGAEPLEIPVPGLNAAERGSLVHRCLELVWDRLGAHATLMEKPDADLRAAIEASVQAPLKAMMELKPRTFTDRFLAIEKERLVGLIEEWMMLERQRAPFSVQAREAALPVTIGGLCLKTFADRIDRLADGRLVIIDYKTGTPRLKDWFTERMAEPQIPLYAVSLDEPLAAVLFGQVRKGDARFLGIAEDEGIAPGVGKIEKESRYSGRYASIAELLPQWRTELQDLAAEVKAGYAVVSPAVPHESCRYCDLGGLCRIKEKELLESARETNA